MPCYAMLCSTTSLRCGMLCHAGGGEHTWHVFDGARLTELCNSIQLAAADAGSVQLGGHFRIASEAASQLHLLAPSPLICIAGNM